MNRLRLQTLCLVGIAGCTGPKEAFPPLALEYNPALVASGFPNPVARLTLGADTAWFIMDSGAGVHTLASWFVESAGIQTDSDLAEQVSGVDATGAAVDFQAVRQVQLHSLEGSALVVDAAMVANFPPVFREQRVAGLLNPRLLAPDSLAAVLDLRVPELRFARLDDAIGRLGAEAIPAEEVRICRIDDAPISNVIYAVHTRSGDYQGWLDLDTGATISDVLTESTLLRGRALVSGGSSMGVAGVAQSHRVAVDLPLTVGRYTATADVAVVEGERDCGEDGRLGLDVLKPCALVFGQASFALTCDPRRQPRE